MGIARAEERLVGRWGEEASAQGTAARSYTPLHATGLHTLPWPACAWEGP